MRRRQSITVVIVALALAVFFGRDFIAASAMTRSDQAFNAGDMATATAFSQRARLLDPTYPAAARRLAMIALRVRTSRNLQSAIDVTDAALRRAPDDETLAMLHAQTLFAAHQYRASALAWYALATSHPRTPLYLGWAAEAARYAGACDLAIQYFSEIARRDPQERRPIRMLAEMRERQEAHQCTTS